MGSDAFDDHMAAALKEDMAKLDALAYRERRERRECIAIAALQGLLANGGRDFGGGTWSYESAAEQAVGFADALIDALDKPVAP